MDDARWQSLYEGIDCPLDAPRAESGEQWDLVAALSVSSLYLSRNQTYRGHCQLIFDPRHAARPDQLTPGEWTAFCADLYRAERAIVRTVAPDHINIESLGNVVPHLHWHIVPRYADDPRWGAPIWIDPVGDMPVTALPATEREALLRDLRGALTHE